MLNLFESKAHDAEQDVAAGGPVPDSQKAHLIGDVEQDIWNHLRAMAARNDISPLRVASSLEPARLAVLLHVQEILNLQLPPDLSLNDMVQSIITTYDGHGRVERGLAHVLYRFASGPGRAEGG